VSSNFERLLFELTGRNGRTTAALIGEFRSSGRLKLGPARWRRLRERFEGARADDEETLAMIAQLWRETGELVDPHTAVGVAASRARRGDGSVPMVTLATAHPAKFPEAVERATGVRPALPPRLADLDSRPERFVVLPNDLAAVQAHVRDRLRVAA
jgi:threonine synthase